MADITISLRVPGVASTQSVAVSTSSAAMATAFTQDGYAIVTVTADCFVIQGISPTATTACMPLLAGSQYRVEARAGTKLAFITSTGSGTAYVTEEMR